MQEREINSLKAEKKDLKELCCDSYEDKFENIENQSTDHRYAGDNCCSEDSNPRHDFHHGHADETCKMEGENFSCACCNDDLLEERESIWTRKNIFVILVSAIIIPIGLYFNYFTDMTWLAATLFLIVISISGYEIIKSGIIDLLKGNIGMNLLMTIAVLVSFAIGSGAEGAIIIFLFYIAEFLEDYAGNRARKSIEKLLKLAPDTATVQRNGETVELNVEDVELGDILVVMPGEKIPLDGVVIKGTSTVNQAAITGESIPVTKTQGNSVFAATLNEEGYLEVRITKRSGETVLSRIIELVRESQKKNPIQRLLLRDLLDITPLQS